MRSHTEQVSSQGRTTFIAGAFVGFLFGVILGLSSCQSGDDSSSAVGQSHPAAVAATSTHPSDPVMLRLNPAPLR